MTYNQPHDNKTKHQFQRIENMLQTEKKKHPRTSAPTGIIGLFFGE